MGWAIPKFENDDVDAAGDLLVACTGGALVSEPDRDHAFSVINNWRSSHSFPLNTFQMLLRKKAQSVYWKSLVAQRIKRLSSIDLKLCRFPWLKLSEMQDIGGCRAVVGSVRSVKRLVNLYKESSIKHKLIHEDNYIDSPKRSGYRGIHLIYRYYSYRNHTYNSLKIEIQLRSELQHAWATAVETVGTFIQQALKSSQGEKEWLRFFALMGTAIAIREGTAPVPSTSTDHSELVRELRDYAKSLDVENRLDTYGRALRILETPALPANLHYFLLWLDAEAKNVRVIGFRQNEQDRATQRYWEIESKISKQAGSDVVLVSVESLASLRRAYPNYFLDTRKFLKIVRQAISGDRGRRGN